MNERTEYKIQKKKKNFCIRIISNRSIYYIIIYWICFHFFSFFEFSFLLTFSTSLVNRTLEELIFVYERNQNEHKIVQ